MRCGVDADPARDGGASGRASTTAPSCGADRVLSSAGYVETMRCRGASGRGTATDADSRASSPSSSRISVLDTRPPSSATTRRSPSSTRTGSLRTRVPDEPVDYRERRDLLPRQLRVRRAPLPEGHLPLTLLANHDAGRAGRGRIPSRAQGRGLAPRRTPRSRAHFAPTCARTRSSRTSSRRARSSKFTGHVNGAVYGSPHKRLDGATARPTGCSCAAPTRAARHRRRDALGHRDGQPARARASPRDREHVPSHQRRRPARATSRAAATASARAIRTRCARRATATT